ncbi:MAG: hypothetical protein ABIV51_07060, partial [Saprospiraceae bacterium]
TSLPQEGFNQANNLTRKWDILGNLSMNYRFSKHFGMNAGFRYGITPYIGGITNSGPGRSQQLLLGMNYFFN